MYFYHFIHYIQSPSFLTTLKFHINDAYLMFVKCLIIYNLQERNKKKVQILCMVIPNSMSSFLESILLSFVKQVSFGTPKIHYLWTPITLYKQYHKYIQIIIGASVIPPHTTHIFLTNGALLAVVCIRDARAPAYGTASLVGPVVALITDTDQRTRTNVGVTHYAETIV